MKKGMKPTKKFKKACKEVEPILRDYAKNIPHRVAILNKGAALTSGDRDATYGDPHRNMTHMAGLLTEYFKNTIMSRYANKFLSKDGKLDMTYHFTPEDAAIIMVLAKLSRLKANPKNPYHEDNYIDAATYTAMAGASRKIQEDSK